MGTSISTAIGTERRAKVSGYQLKKGSFGNKPHNLPQKIAVFGEANTANQGALSTDAVQITSADQAGKLFGYGSPLHMQFRILHPYNGGGAGGIPTFAFPQESDAGATASVDTWTISGTATKNARHTIVINGRNNLDFKSYSFSILKDATAIEVCALIAAAVNGVPNCSVTAIATGASLELTTKWKGATATGLNVDFDIQANDNGITYAQASRVEGAGDVDISGSLAQFGTEWFTIVVNPYADTQPATLATLEQFNGKPDPTTPTGRYSTNNFAPFVALGGNNSNTVVNLLAVTNQNDRLEEVTNVLCPAPLSTCYPFEQAADTAKLLARVGQDTPELDVQAMDYTDIPVPSNGLIGDMSDYNNRDLLVQGGCSTVILDKGAYKIQDLVTMYHIEGETPLQFNYVRNLFIDWNIKDSYYILEKLYVREHVLLADNQISDAIKTIKPKQWKAVLYDFFDSLAIAALITDPEFSKESLEVEIDPSNPNRFNTFFRYKRTGVSRIESTTAEAGF